MGTVSATIIAKGLVQGVFFRDSTRGEARKNNVTGFVRNNPDGTVCACFEGAEDAVKQMIEWCRRGPENAQVTDLQVTWNEETGNFADFSIDY